MYHALVRVDGQWTSFGLHVPLQEWTTVLVRLQRAHGKENVAHVVWNQAVELRGVHDVEALTRAEVRLANRAQQQWDHSQVANGGQLDLARAIEQLRQPLAA
jgi:hypothetical protein